MASSSSIAASVNTHRTKETLPVQPRFPSEQENNSGRQLMIVVVWGAVGKVVFWLSSTTTVNVISEKAFWLGYRTSTSHDEDVTNNPSFYKYESRC